MKRSITAVLVLALLLAAAFLFSRRTPPPPEIAGNDSPEYVDSSQCADCHAGIAETYRKTGMGRSFFKPSAAAAVEDFKTNNTFYHAASDRYYTMIERDGRYFQRRHQLGPDGHPTNIVEHEAHYVIGSGNHVRTYLQLNEKNKLIQLPIAWYSEKGGYWGMNPGYDWQHHSDFRRRITLECVFCHNAYPDSKKESDRADAEAVFPGPIPQGIDCQRCHGPGGAHVRAPQADNIVNPARLSRERNLEVCMQCHLETTSAPLPYAVRRFDRGVFSYQPGEPLADYMLHFDHGPGTGHDDKFEIASAAYRLGKSRCFLESETMTCTTCHDPHNIPRGEEADRHYAAVCQGCHSVRHTPSNDCVGCHMPRRRTDDVVHAVMTDHYIQRQKPGRDLLAPLAERHGPEEVFYKGEVSLYYPPVLPAGADAELYTAVAQVTAKANLKEGIRRLSAAIEKHQPASSGFYFELAKAFSEENATDQAIAMYRKALERRPDFWPAAHRLGLALSRTVQPDRAVEFLRRAGDRSNEGTVLNDLGLLYGRLGRPSEAVDALTRSAALDPGLPHVYNNLGGTLLDSGDLKGAEEAFRKAILVQPDLAAAHGNLARVLLNRGEIGQAQYHFQKGIALSAAKDPGRSEARLALAGITELQGKLDEAILHYRALLEEEPASSKAHFGLASILLMRHKPAEALIHFREAARGSDESIRQQAAEAIRKIGQ